MSFNIGDNLGYNLALSLNSTNNFSLTFRTPTTLTMPSTTDISFVNFYFPGQLGYIF